MKIRLEGTLEFSNRVLGYAKVRRYSGRLSGLGGYGCACALADLRSSDYRWIAGIAGAMPNCRNLSLTTVSNFRFCK